MYKFTKTHGFVASSLLIFAMAGVHAQSVPGTALPPPDIDDPGVQPAAARTSVAEKPLHDPLPGGAAAAPGDNALPDIKFRREGEDTVQEYSHNGRVYMIKVIPKRGVPQTYLDTDGDGRLDIKPGESPVAPVYYTLYEWGKPKPRTDSDSGSSDQR